jgi:hypothetical protein
MWEQNQNWERSRQHCEQRMDEARRERMMQDGEAAPEKAGLWHELADRTGEALIGLGQALKQKAQHSTT